MKHKKLVRPRIPMFGPTRCNERLSIDFVPDQFADGRHFYVLNIFHDISRDRIDQLTDTRFFSWLGDRLQLDVPKSYRGARCSDCTTVHDNAQLTHASLPQV